MSVLIKGLEMPETGYMDVRIFRDGTAAIATGTKPYYRELKAEPVRHGKWKCTYSPNGFLLEQTCSECGLTFEEPSGHDYNYCPQCGARMDAEND